MDLSKALSVIMARWNISQYALGKASGVRQPSISAIILGKSKTSELETIHKLANGLEAIDPLAKATFWAALQLPDEMFDRIPIPPGSQSPMLETQMESAARNPYVLDRAITVLDGFGLIDRDALEQKKQLYNQFKPYPSMTFGEYLVALSIVEKQNSLKDGDKDENQE